MEVENRIKEHQISIRKLNDKKVIVEKDLKRINEKITFHNTAIINLGIKAHQKYDN